MHKDGASSIVEGLQVFFHLANTADGTLEYFLDEDPLLWMDDLIVTLLQLPVDLNVLDVEDSIVGPTLLNTPELTVLYTKTMEDVSKSKMRKRKKRKKEKGDVGAR